MPVYTYRCELCGEEKDALVPYGQRLEAQPCDACHLGNAVYQFPCAMLGTEQKRGDRRIIRDERELGSRWRDQGTTGKPGGAGKSLFFDQGKP